jgi:hypothetical protein
MASLNFKTNESEVKNVKFNKKGKGSGGTPTLDIKIHAVCGASVMKPLIGSDSTLNLWRHDGDCDPMFPGMGPFECLAKFENHFMNIAGTDIKAVNLSKFEAKVMPGKSVKISFNASISDPSEKEIEAFKMALKGVGPMTIAGVDLVDDADDDEDGDDHPDPDSDND